MPKFLAHAVLHRGKVYRNSIVEIVDGEVHIARFDRELPSTTFVPGLIAVCASERVTDSVRGAMLYKVQSAPLIERAIMRLSEYLESSRLYVGDQDTPMLVLLPRK